MFYHSPPQVDMVMQEHLMRIVLNFFTCSSPIEDKFLSLLSIGNMHTAIYSSTLFFTDTTVSSLDLKNWQTLPVPAFNYSRVINIQKGGDD
jgi:hypothetical protein